jgi:hypothetical protein
VRARSFYGLSRRELTGTNAGRWPERITVVGYEMKRERFTALHRAALRFPVDRFSYIGIGLDPREEPDAWAGEVLSFVLAP